MSKCFLFHNQFGLIFAMWNLSFVICKGHLFALWKYLCHSILTKPYSYAEKNGDTKKVTQYFFQFCHTFWPSEFFCQSKSGMSLAFPYAVIYHLSYFCDMWFHHFLVCVGSVYAECMVLFPFLLQFLCMIFVCCIQNEMNTTAVTKVILTEAPRYCWPYQQLTVIQLQTVKIIHLTK